MARKRRQRLGIADAAQNSASGNSNPQHPKQIQIHHSEYGPGYIPLNFTRRKTRSQTAKDQNVTIRTESRTSTSKAAAIASKRAARKARKVERRRRRSRSPEATGLDDFSSLADAIGDIRGDIMRTDKKARRRERNELKGLHKYGYTGRKRRVLNRDVDGDVDGDGSAIPNGSTHPRGNTYPDGIANPDGSGGIKISDVNSPLDPDAQPQPYLSTHASKRARAYAHLRTRRQPQIQAQAAEQAHRNGDSDVDMDNAGYGIE